MTKQYTTPFNCYIAIRKALTLIQITAHRPYVALAKQLKSITLLSVKVLNSL